jgi:phosphatidate cytidylyltransferase
MLKQRVITALVLLAFLLPALFAASPWPFAVLTLLMVGAAGWEWARLNSASPVLAIAMGVGLAAASALALAGGWMRPGASPAWWLACGVWVLGGGMALRGGPKAWPGLPQAARWVLGLVLLWTAWLALASAKVVGTSFLLSLFALVWMADVSAYFGGKAFGRHKLALSISPGKSWEGVWSGMVGVMVLAAVWIYVDRSMHTTSPNVFTMLLNRLDVWGLVLALVFLSAMSVVGDLVESLVKRAAGAKDSSQLLPGHGGVLDRIDALLPVLPIAMALSFF